MLFLHILFCKQNQMTNKIPVEYALSPLQRFRGLMFRKDFKGKMVFRFTRLCTILVHTFFMRFSIDVRFYNEKNEMIKEVKNMKPWRFVYVKNVKCFSERKSEEQSNLGY